MHLLRNVLVAMVTRSSSSSSPSTTTTVSTSNNDPSGTLAAIKKEVIETLRKVVEVISKYAGTGLPEQAKQSVRSFILALPSRWALLNSTTNSTSTTTSTTVRNQSSPLNSPTLTPHVSSELQDTSIKLLNFGSESVEMLQSVSTVFSGTIDSANIWLDRLHSVGVTRHSTTTTAGVDAGAGVDADAGAGADSKYNDASVAPAPIETSTTSEPMEIN